MRLTILKIALLVIFFLANVNMVFSQNVDSLENIIKLDVPNKDKFKALQELTWMHLQRDIDKSLRYANQLLNITSEMDDKVYLGRTYSLLVICYNEKDYGLDTITNVYNRGIAIADKIDDLQLKGILYNNMARTYARVGQIDKALSLYQEGLLIDEKLGSPRGATRTMGNIGNMMVENKNYIVAKYYYQKAIKHAKKQDDQAMVSQLGLALGSVYSRENKIDSALTLYENALLISTTNKNHFTRSIALSNIGSINLKKKNYELSLTNLQKSYEFAKKLNSTYCMGMALSNMCDVYFEQQDHYKAISTAMEGLGILGEYGDLKSRMEFYKNLSDNYEAIGDYQLAFENQQQYHVLNDSIYNLEKTKQINNLTIKFEVDQKEMENKQLKVEKVANEKALQNRNLIALALFLGLLLIGTWGVFVYRSRLKTKKYNEVLELEVEARTIELQAANKKLKQANTELTTFNYIASHDIKEPIRNIGSYVSLIKRRINSDERERLKDYFDIIKNSTTQIYTLLEDVINYSKLSQSESIKKQEVDLNSLLETIEDKLEPRINTCNGQINYSSLPTIQGDISLLFPALKNIIDNGLKFNQSEKPKIDIVYQKLSNQHSISIQDNGIGIDSQYNDYIFEMFKRLHDRQSFQGSGLGLAVTKTAIEKLGGSIKIISKEGSGSTFNVLLPTS